MAKKNYSWFRGVRWVILLTIASQLFGCSGEIILRPYIPCDDPVQDKKDGYAHDCKIMVKQCKAEETTTSAILMDPSVKPSKAEMSKEGLFGTYSWDEPNWKAYIEDRDNWAYAASSSDYFIGCYWIKTETGAALWGGPYITVTPTDFVENLLVAFDERAVKGPAWLENKDKWQPLRQVCEAKDRTTCPQHWVEMIDPSGSKRRFSVWRYVDSEFHSNGGFNIAVNFGGNDENTRWDWGHDWDKNPKMMYTILLKPPFKPDQKDCANKQPFIVYPPPPKACADDKDQAEEIVKAYSRDYGIHYGAPLLVEEIRCKRATYTEEGKFNCCKSSRLGRAQSSLSVLRPDPKKPLSETAILSTSTVKVDVKDNGSFSSNVDEGTVFFDFDDQTKDLRLLDMKLTVAPQQIEHLGPAENISARLSRVALAKCAIPQIASNQPCSTYKIPVDAFEFEVFLRLEGDWMAIRMKNDGPVLLSVDQTNWTFEGLISSSGPVTVNGETLSVSATLDLKGKFTNFVPRAVPFCRLGDHAPCLELKNSAPIVHDGSKSYAINGALTDYEWYEFFGTAYQKQLGTGHLLTIPPGKLSPGVHKFTLLVRDDKAFDTADISITITDNKAPSIILIKGDIVTSDYPTGTDRVKIDIGDATVRDTCCLGKAAIKNDAPADGMFPPGVTYVKWSARDCAGDLAKAVQKVHVRVKCSADSDCEKLAGGYAPCCLNGICSKRIACRREGQLKCRCDSSPQLCKPCEEQVEDRCVPCTELEKICDRSTGKCIAR